MRKFEDKYLITHNFNFNPNEIVVTPEIIKGSIVHMYDTLDMIDSNLISRGVQKMSSLVELANLSSIVGNLLGAGFADFSNGFYYRNKPHTYPDLVASDNIHAGIEIKTALVKNLPKGHLPKAGYYLTYRYCLTDPDGKRDLGTEETWDTVTIWEVKLGYLNEDDFSCSNTRGDSGKTAVIKTSSLNNMPLLYLDTSIIPYVHTAQKPYNGFN